MTEPRFRVAWARAVPGGLASPAQAGLARDELEQWYATPESWLRANMAVTLDGAVSGADGRSGSINNAADHVVFGLLRQWSEAIVVGAGTARAEEYGAASRPLVLVSRRGEVPTRLRGLPAGRVVLATVVASPGHAEAVELLGAENVLAFGAEGVDFTRVRPALVERGWGRLLCEGGPSLLHALVDQGVVDEITATVVPRLVAGNGPRMLHGELLDRQLELTGLLAADDGTLFGRWRLQSAEQPARLTW